ncbi:MAG: DUF3108 domain-containing protein [Bacteroidetes bacterium]|nr:DUF3108 domain-containing protein [Bacteroidota bacterium]
MYRYLVALLMTTYATGQTASDDFCGISNSVFAPGEKVVFKVFYNVIGIYVDAGDATFTVEKTLYQNRPTYHLTGLGTSNPHYDWIFKVRDKYESYIDTATLRPYRFQRDVYEGGYTIKETVQFDPVKNRAVTAKGSYSVPPCVQDVLSAIYYARNIDFNRYKPGDKIPFHMFIDEQVYPVYIRYLGKEVVKNRFGRYRAIKFSPLLISGTLFSGGEKMVVWVSDDGNRIPLRIESPISVGSVKVDMKSCYNLRYPFTSQLAKEK